MAPDRYEFWREAFTWHGSATPHAIPHVLAFGGFAAAVWWLSGYFEATWHIRLALEVGPFELAGAVLGLLLVLRTNAGYDRWWEARKLWGGIVNQSRNLAISALSYGPADARWREQIVRWTAAFPHVARCSLRDDAPDSQVLELVGPDQTEQLRRANHMPSYVAMRLATLLQEAMTEHQLDRFAFLQIDKERAALIDHLGGCERILKTPLPLAYSIKIRRFIVLFLTLLPFALLQRVHQTWLIPFLTMLVAYPLISLDQIGDELQNPFSKTNLSHLPLDSISATIENNLRSLPGGIDATLPAREGIPQPVSDRPQLGR